MDLLELEGFGKEFLLLCKKQKIVPIIYGSYLLRRFSGFDVAVHDLDFYVEESDFPIIVQIANSMGWSVEHSKKWHTLHITKKDLKIECDSLGHWYDGPSEFPDFEFDGVQIRSLSIEGLKHIYLKASKTSDQKEKNKKKYGVLCS